MRFITEFELEYPYTLDKPYAHILSSESDMGKMIGDVLGWKEKPYKTHGGKEGNRWTLEIEAFPMDKWIEFKQKLFMECGMPEPNGVAILEMIKELEFYGEKQKLPG